MFNFIIVEENKETQSSYGKKSVWQWIVIYIVLGAVIYGLIYYFVLAKKGNKNPYLPSGQTNNQGVTNVPTSSVIDNGMEQEEANVTLTETGYSPQTVTVITGTRVIWTNQSGSVASVYSAVHPTHKVYPPLNLGEFNDGETLSLIFDTPGSYKYHNHLNPSQTGTVVVE